MFLETTQACQFSSTQCTVVSFPPVCNTQYLHTLCKVCNEYTFRTLCGDGEALPCSMIEHTKEQVELSCLILTPLKLVPPGTHFSEICGPTLKNLFPL